VGEVAVAAIELEQVPRGSCVPSQALRLRARPAQHVLVHVAVGLGEAAFELLVAQGEAVDRQHFLHPVASEHDLLFAAAADELDVQVGRERARGDLPGLVERAVVDEADQALAAQRGEEVDLENLAAQGFAGLEGVAQARHQARDRFCGGGKAVDQDRLLRVGAVEHRVVDAAVVVPQAKLGAQAVVQRRGAEDLRRGEVELGEVGAVAVELGGELVRVVRGVDDGQGHVDQFSSAVSSSGSASARRSA
jgi:hypothetical protein